MFSKYFCVLLIILFAAVYSSAEWVIEDVDVNGGDPHISFGDPDTIAIDSLGYPHIVYDRFNTSPPNDQLKYAYWDGIEWHLSILNEASSGSYSGAALNVNSQDNSVLFYPDTQFLYYSVYNGTEWNTTIIDSNSIDPDAAIDESNCLHITYSRGGVKRGFYDGTTWSFSVIDSGSNSSIAVDANSNERIAYSDSYLTPPPFPYVMYELNYAVQNGTNWTFETIDTSMTGAGIEGTDIAVDSNGYPHILYKKGLAICYAYEVGAGWQLETIDTSDMGCLLTKQAIVLDPLDHPHITYQLNNNGSFELKYAVNLGSGWQFEIIDPGASYRDPHITLTSSGIPYICYGYHYGWPDPLDSLRCAYNNDQTGIKLTNFTANSRDDGTVKLNWEVSDPVQIGTLGYNLYRVESKSKDKKDLRKINDQIINGRSPYNYIDQSALKGIKYRYKLAVLTSSGKETIIGSTTNSSPANSMSFDIISIFPQPANSILTCRLNIQQATTIKLSLYDLSGRFLESRQANANPGDLEIGFSTQNLANGIYFIKATNGINQRTAKVLIAH